MLKKKGPFSFYWGDTHHLLPELKGYGITIGKFSISYYTGKVRDGMSFISMETKIAENAFVLKEEQNG